MDIYYTTACDLHFLVANKKEYTRLAYLLYPVELHSDQLEQAAEKYQTGIAVVTGMDWNNDLTPWYAPARQKNGQSFGGHAPDFLRRLEESIYEIERKYDIRYCERTLVGVSLGGLFAMWQWSQSDLFRNIAALSGSFWYDDFTQWVTHQNYSIISGRAYFLLGDKEGRSKSFKTIESDTRLITDFLVKEQIDAEMESVPGDHFHDPEGRLDKALAHFFNT